MFGSLGLPEILVILVLALLIFGPKRLPEVGRTIGRGLSEFRRATTDLKRSVNAELTLEEDERPATTRRPPQGVGRTMAEAATSRELPGPAPTTPTAQAPEGTAPRGEDTEPAGSTEGSEPARSTEGSEPARSTEGSEPAGSTESAASDDSADSPRPAGSDRTAEADPAVRSG
jgi:TatA/E family protein of Tat protein translocase